MKVIGHLSAFLGLGALQALGAEQPAGVLDRPRSRDHPLATNTTEQPTRPTSRASQAEQSATVVIAPQVLVDD
jgi:hypothetical protein